MFKKIFNVPKVVFYLVLVNSLANAGTITFTDDFEAQSFDPFWTNISQQYGTVALSSDQAQSGLQSAKFSSTSGGQRWLRLKHEFSDVKEGNVSVWFYDTAPGQQTLYAFLTLYNTTITYPQPGSFFNLGIQDWDGSNYFYSSPIQTNVRTSISRTAGWHKFEIKIGSTGGQMFIDGTLVHSFTGDYGFNSIELVVFGPGWRPNATYYFDDFSLNAFSNTPPVANAGGNKSVLVGDTVILDGTGSSDADGDPLTYNWTFVSKPAGSTATLSSLTSPTTSFVADASGNYDVNLTVNDGTVDSDPDSANIFAITVLNAMTQVLDDAVDTINNIPPADFTNPKQANALTKKINAVLKMVEKEQYQEALDKLTNDILAKADGCANGGEPDQNDWIRTCAEQDVVHSLIMEAIGIVNNQL